MASRNCGVSIAVEDSIPTAGYPARHNRRVLSWRIRLEGLAAAHSTTARATSSKKEKEQEQDYEAAAAPYGSALHAATDSFHLRRGEFREFGCFHGFLLFGSWAGRRESTSPAFDKLI